MNNKEYPRIVVGDVASGGKTIAQIQELVRLVKKLDGTDKRNLLIAENYNKELQQLSDGSIGLRYGLISTIH